MYTWKRVSDGFLAQDRPAETAEALFEAAGFGAVDVDKPLKGWIATKVRQHGAMLVEVPAEEYRISGPTL